MKQEIRKVYRCDYCGKKYFHKGYCARHEDLCCQNPDNKRPCFECLHFARVEAETYIDRNGPYLTENKIKINVFYCLSRGIALIPPQSVKKGKRYDYVLIADVEVENIEMPRECRSFVDKLIEWRQA